MDDRPPDVPLRDHLKASETRSARKFTPDDRSRGRRTSLRGVYRIHRYDRETGEYLGTIRGENSITTAGRDLFLDLGIGDSSSVLDNANSVIEVEDSGGSDVFTQAGADTGFPDLSTQGQATWQWSDETANEYTVDTIRVRQGSLTGTIFSEFAGTLSGGNDKPSNENWIYEWTISFSSSQLTDAGAHSWLEILVGDLASGSNWSNAQLRVEDDGGSLVGAVGIDSGFPSRSGGTITWQFTAEDGTAEGTWHDPIVRSITWPDGDVVLSQDAGGGDSEGTKSSGEVWEYAYTLTVNLA